eukprot:m.181260 g.181260  ORF g.181260 m.181260 type:complete len:450 (+) comp15203_c0_seq1:212-1561(+)
MCMKRWGVDLICERLTRVDVGGDVPLRFVLMPSLTSRASTSHAVPSFARGLCATTTHTTAWMVCLAIIILQHTGHASGTDPTVATGGSAVCRWLSSLLLDHCGALACTRCSGDAVWSPRVEQCRPPLSCRQRDTVMGWEPLAAGGVKQLGRATLDGLPVVVATALRPDLGDFADGVMALRDLAARPGAAHTVVPLLGWCTDTSPTRSAPSPWAVTPFYRLGSADRLDAVLSSLGMQADEALLARLTAAESYIEALCVLHGYDITTPLLSDAQKVNRSRFLPRVLCDGREGPLKLLSQFLIADTTGRLLLNDVDAAPALNPSCPTREGHPGIRCGHRQFSTSDFVAPEMLWPHGTQPFVDADMPCYTEKIDIWRVPATVAHLVPVDAVAVASVSAAATTVFQRRMARLRTLCEAHDPNARPSAPEVLELVRHMARPLRTAAIAGFSHLDH